MIKLKSPAEIAKMKKSCEIIRDLLLYMEEKVRPGITDFSSIAFIDLDEIVGTENADEMYEKLVLKRKNELRVQYAHSVSFCTDIIILGKTSAAVIRKCLRAAAKKK